MAHHELILSVPKGEENMKTEEWGYTNPVVSYLYGKPPLVWKDMRVQLVVYETDIENVRRVIPEPLEARRKWAVPRDGSSARTGGPARSSNLEDTGCP